MCVYVCTQIYLRLQVNEQMPKKERSGKPRKKRQERGSDNGKYETIKQHLKKRAAKPDDLKKFDHYCKQIIHEQARYYFRSENKVVMDAISSITLPDGAPSPSPHQLIRTFRHYHNKSLRSIIHAYLAWYTGKFSDEGEVIMTLKTSLEYEYQNKTIKKNTGAETNHSKLIYRKEVKLYTVDKNKVHVARRDGLEISREVVI